MKKLVLIFAMFVAVLMILPSTVLAASGKGKDGDPARIDREAVEQAIKVDRERIQLDKVEPRQEIFNETRGGIEDPALHEAFEPPMDIPAHDEAILEDKMDELEDALEPEDVEEALEDAAEDEMEAAEDAAEEAMDAAEDAAEEAMDAAEDEMEAAEDAAEEAMEAAEDEMDAAEDAAEEAMEAAEDEMEAAEDAAEEAMEAAELEDEDVDEKKVGEVVPMEPMAGASEAVTKSFVPFDRFNPFLFDDDLDPFFIDRRAELLEDLFEDKFEDDDRFDRDFEREKD